MKTTIELEFSRMRDNDLKYYRNLFTGLALFVAALLIIKIIMT